jgi:Do/DeqQ family serine protease
MKKMKQLMLIVAVSAVSAVGSVWIYGKYVNKKSVFTQSAEAKLPVNYTGFFDNISGIAEPIDFTKAANAAVPGVVHIKTKIPAKRRTNNLGNRNNSMEDFFEQFFGPQLQPEQRASGSGVIISDDGYIVTNNHVVSDGGTGVADEITVTLHNKKTYKAKVVGTDPSYDLSVIKIEASALPFLLYGNSDDVKIGQWVLAIGYPLNLETTVTAGIISAKARTLGLNKDRNGDARAGVESFIQTDAAVNMGNSGGALVTTDGKLIGVNSAIASPTGYYSGYSYAIPVNIVKKVVDDLIKFGTVQRGFLGVSFVNASDLNDDDKKRQGIPVSTEGIYVTEAPTDGAAYAAGIRKGDILKTINGIEINNGAEMQGLISRQKPGDKLPVTYVRNGKENAVLVTLKNKAGNYEVVKAEAVLEALGADLVTLDAKKAKDYGVAGGVIVKKINEGALNDQTRMKDGFIILKVNDKEVKSVDELKALIGSNKDITISGFYPGYEGVYEYPISLSDQ